LQMYEFKFYLSK